MTSVDLQVQQTGLAAAESTGFMRLLSVAGDRVIDLFPDAEETAVVTAEEPAFFRLEAAAEGAVGNKLVDCLA